MNRFVEDKMMSWDIDDFLLILFSLWKVTQDVVFTFKDMYPPVTSLMASSRLEP